LGERGERLPQRAARGVRGRPGLRVRSAGGRRGMVPGSPVCGGRGVTAVRRIASVLLLLVFGTLGVAIATQYVAAALHNPAELGTPCLGAGESAVYAPWAWIRGGESLGRRAPEVARNAGAISAAAAVVEDLPL